MQLFKYSYLFCLISVFGLFSCNDPDEYTVDSEFAVYLERFQTEAAKNNKTFDLQATGLIIEFAKLKNNIAGLTHYEDPIRIEIDKNYWAEISNTAGADLMKENLIFHELGHGLLGREHLNTTLENGEWKSIMCGGDKINDRSWNINYRGERKQYYLDELFKENTPEPEFSSNLLLVDTTGFSKLIERNFESVDQMIWSAVDDSDHKISLDNGRLRFQSKVDDIYLIYVNLKDSPIDINSNFAYELTLQYPAGDATNQYGIVFGPVSSDGVNDPVEYFSINNNKKMFMGNRSWYSYFTELEKQSIINAGKNKLKIFKIGTFIYYFINNTYCYSSEIEASSNLNQFGFMVPSQGTMWIDNFIVYQKTNSKKTQKVNQNINLEFNTSRVKSLNQGVIRNK
jgi:hypothetical protein